MMMNLHKSVPEKQFKQISEQQLKQKYASEQDQYISAGSPTRVDQVPIVEQENLKTRSPSKQVNVR